ncbi:RND family efflux transporter MFP subunit [Isoalcanivorax pacificus W11-5]|uniref:RND family efflux transporter MFP subunit n=1 Tax=Isoalcanivorax pacificus W11-5 TaxID=391936 RepID=A0A0B4XQB9_9GAMM|nr:efflux RND transporter periplasmic adaptor subunit [Isoalcanivorax pacificus]AJD48940.1 RND family efflux transporter MFP subunit [Isoalcanivorax pacificus W11-5]
MPSRVPSRSVLLAVVLTVLLLLWLLLGDRQTFRADAPEAQAGREATLPRVEVVVRHAQPHAASIRAQGQLLPWREVELRARVAGQVQRRRVEEGDRVASGAVLLEIDREDLPAQLARSEAELAARQAELDGAEKLHGRQLVSANELLRLKASVAEAQADEATLRQRLAHTRPVAPFAGVINRIDAEPGDFLQVGDNYTHLVDDATLRASAWVGQREVLQLAVGQAVQVTLLDGSEMTGEVNFIASRADENTRSYRVEVTVPNPEHRRIAGASATLDIALPAQPAHRVSPALLVLDDAGRMGVKYLDDDDQVQFGAVRLLSASSSAAWVAGLPETLRLISLGGGFVEPGAKVEAVPAQEDAQADVRKDTAPATETEAP